MGGKEPDNLLESAQQEVRIAHRPWYQINRVGLTFLGVYALLLLLFTLLAWWVELNPVDAIDVAITHSLQQIQAPWFQWLMVVISLPGNSAYFMIGLTVLIAVVFWLVRLRLEAIVLAVHGLVSVELNNLLKLLVDRPRPEDVLVHVLRPTSGTSFPSGHVMSYMALFGLLFAFGIIGFKGWPWWKIVWLTISGFFVLTVGLSRIALGAHWASDVLGAYLIGGVLLGITLGIYLRIKSYRSAGIRP
jgi:undecaprenyl-diphosphatase